MLFSPNPVRQEVHQWPKRRMFTIEKINSLEVLRALKDEWESLLARCPHRMPFLTYDWMMTWWKHFGEGKELCVLVLRENGRAVAIAPLMKYWGRFYDRYLKFPALVIETMANYHSNRVDLIFSEFRDEYLTQLWEYLLTQEEWHIVRFYPVPADSPMVAGLRRLVERQGVRAAFLKDQTSPYITVQNGWNDYTRHLSCEIKLKARRAERLASDKKPTTEIFTQSTDIDSIVHQIFEVAEKGWAAQEGTAISSTAQLRGFYTDLAHLANQQGWLFFSLLKVGGNPVAYEYNIRHDQTIYNLKVSFDPAFSRQGPGHILKYSILSKLFQNGQSIREYDFLGDVAPYKLKWTQQMRPHLRIYLYHPHSDYARLLHFIQSKLILPMQARWRREL